MLWSSMTLERHVVSRPRAAAWAPAALSACVLAVPSCGGAPAPPQAPAAQAAAPRALAPPSPELGAVPDPPGLVVTGRIGRPAALLATARAWSRLPVPQSEEVTELLAGDALGPLVDLDQPIDFAVAVVGAGARMRDRTAVSAALKDPERAKAALSDRFKLTPGDNGALVIQPAERSGDDQAAGEEDRRACEIAPAFGPSPMRLVCGWTPKALSELAPWLTRTATRAPVGSDVHVELRMQPLRPTLAGQKRLLGSLLSTALGSRLDLSGARDLVTSVCGDLVDFALDLEGATLDVQAGDAAVTASLTLRLSSATSALARTAAGHAERNAPAPAAFAQLPADTELGIFERGVDDPLLARARDLALGVVSDELNEGGFKEADRKPLVDALAKLASPAALVYAAGMDLDALAKAAAAERAARDGADPAALADAARTSTLAMLGWHLLEVDEPAARWSGALKDLEAALGRPGFAAAYRSKFGARAPSLHPAPLPKGAPQAPGTEHHALDVYPAEPSRVAAAAPAGKKAPVAAAAKPLTLDILIAPDGPRTWIGLGGGDALVASKLAAAMAPSGDKVASRADLGLLRGQAVGSGGFFTLRGLPESVPDREVLEELAQLPHGGSAAIAYSLTPLPEPAPGQPGAAQVALTVSVPRAAVEDVVAETLRHGGF